MSEVAEIRIESAALASLHELVAAAALPLVWLLDADAAPTEGALAALLDHAPGPAASLPVDAGGRAVRALMGRVAEDDQEAILDSIEHRRQPLRHIALTSLLVERDLVLGLSPPDPRRFGWYAGTEWTARLFSRRRGVLVPESRVSVTTAPAGSPVEALRAARSACWRKGETVRELQRAIKHALR